MKREELAEWWRLYVRMLAALLGALDAAHSSPPPVDVLQQIEVLQREALLLHVRRAPLQTPLLDFALQACPLVETCADTCSSSAPTCERRLAFRAC